MNATISRRNWTSQFFEPTDHAEASLKNFFIEGHFKQMPQPFEQNSNSLQMDLETVASDHFLSSSS